MAQDNRADETSRKGPGGGPDGGQGPGVPRWLKVIGIVVAALIVLLILAQMTGIAGDHGPGRHIGGLAPIAAAPAAAVGSPVDGPRR